MMMSFRALLRQVNIEPVILIAGVSVGVYFTVLQVFVYRKQCMQLFATELSGNDLYVFCRDLSSKARNDSVKLGQEDAVQQAASTMGLYLQLAYCVPAAFTSLVLGAWADRNGRKPVLLLSLVGQACTYLPALLCATLQEATLWYFFGGLFFCGLLSGGVVTGLGTVLAMVTDESPSAVSRPIRLGVAGAFLTGGVVIGGVISSYILSQWDSFVVVFIVAQVSMLIACVYCALFARETVHNTRTPKEELADFFTLTQFSDAFLIVARPREGYKRSYFIIGLIVFFFYFACDLGSTTGLVVLFLKEPPLSWTDSHYGYYNAASTAVGAFGMVFLMVIFKKALRWGDTMVIVVGLVATIARWIIFAFAAHDWMIYLFVVIGFVSSPIYPTMRSFLASQVDSHEIGKAFSAVATVENFSPIFASLIFTKIYTASLTTFPGLPFLVSAVMQIPCLLAPCWLWSDGRPVMARRFRLFAQHRSLFRSTAPVRLEVSGRSPIGVSCLVPYLPHYLQIEKAFSTVDVTTLLAASRMLAVFTKPLVGHVADRTGRYRATIMVTLIIGSALLLSVRFLPRVSIDSEHNLTAGQWDSTSTIAKANHFSRWEFYVLAFCLITSHTLGLSCCYTLMDAQTLRLLSNKRAFGRQRLWMIVGIATVLMPVSLWADQTTSTKANYDPAFVGFGLCMLAAGSCSQMVNPSVGKSAACSSGRGGLLEICRVMRRRSTLAFLAMTLVCGMNYGMSVWLMPFYLKSDLGANQTTVGCAMLAVCAAAVVAFYFSDQVIGCIGHEMSLAACLLLYGIRAMLWSIMRAPQLWSALLIESLLGFSFGLWLSTMGAYAGQIAPLGSQASAQAVLSAVFDGLGVGLGNFVSGLLYQTQGGAFTWRAFSLATTSIGSMYAFVICVEKLRARSRMEKRRQPAIIYSEPIALLFPNLEIVSLRKETTIV
uniref:Major facilitator superfamily (MFS) profile domain-containing protein n=1 Tax=Plectus sambesii TaxID=2011161 RepID=A0A914XQY5_9BILA